MSHFQITQDFYARSLKDFLPCAFKPFITTYKTFKSLILFPCGLFYRYKILLSYFTLSLYHPAQVVLVIAPTVQYTLT